MIEGINSRGELEAFIREAIDRSEIAAIVKQGQAAMLSGTGSPENVVAAPVGVVYRREDGGAGTTFYVKETGGSGDTGWDAK